MRKRYVLIHPSGSLQNASYSHPRVMLANATEDFFITFNDDPSQHGYETIETLSQLEDPQGQNLQNAYEEFVFETDLEVRRSHLLSEGKDRSAIFAELDDRSQRTGRNPPICLGCHRNNPRPNWAAFPFWVGTFGGNRMEMKVGSREWIGFKQFLRTSEKPKSRYQQLVNLSNFRNEVTRLEALQQRTQQPQTLLMTIDPRYSESSLSSLNSNFSEFNYRRLAQDLAKHPRFEQFKWAILAATNSCDFTQFLPAPLAFSRSDWEKTYLETRLAHK